MALAGKLYQEGDEHEGPRAQTTASVAGVRPGVPQDLAPQLGVEHAELPCSSGAPSLSPPALGDDSSLDSATISFLVREAVEA